jgi:acyl-CoA thioesterase FadM
VRAEVGESSLAFEELNLTWDLPTPHTITVSVAAADIDAYDHVNNSVYMNWFDRVAWDHSAAVDLPIERCLSLDRGMVVLRVVRAHIPNLRLCSVASSIRFRYHCVP